MRTTKELLDIATNHVSGEDAVRVIFDHHKQKEKHVRSLMAASTANSTKERRKTSGSKPRC
jgi:hypothetical protein